MSENMNDHARGCQGREYTCTCGYDDQREWQPIETAPKDVDILVWFDHSADPYQDPSDPNKLTSYGAWAEGGDFMDGVGICIAKWFESTWESVDEYGAGYHMPAWWFAKHFGDYEYSVNPTHWMHLPTPPEPLSTTLPTVREE